MLLITTDTSDFWLWVLLMSFFHFTEWFATALYNLPKLSVNCMFPARCVCVCVCVCMNG
jgi:hypothetical protein